MTRLLHLVDASMGWEQRLAITQLLDRLSEREFRQWVVAVDGMARPQLGPHRRNTPLFARRLGLDFLAAPALRRYIDRRRIDLIHAWGARAAAAAEYATHTRRCPVVLTVFHPGLANRDVSFLRSTNDPSGRPVVCATQTVHRRLVEQGVDAARCVVIRVGVDFSTLNQVRKSTLRNDLELTPDHTLVVVPEPVTPTGGQFAAFWATAIRSFLDPNVRVVIPGRSREQRRLQRLAERLNFQWLIVRPGPDVLFEHLVGIADLAIVAPTGEVSGTTLAWAMAAGVPIIGTAVYSVAEAVAHDLNGILFKPAPAKRLATSLARAMGDRDHLRRLAEVARGQAFEVFSLRRFIDQYRRFYDNVLNRRWPGQDIVDAAYAGGVQAPAPGVTTRALDAPR
jgi:glycosyltransferase involved in cell wall biosynthesis